MTTRGGRAGLMAASIVLIIAVVAFATHAGTAAAEGEASDAARQTRALEAIAVELREQRRASDNQVRALQDIGRALARCR